MTLAGTVHSRASSPSSPSSPAPSSSKKPRIADEDVQLEDAPVETTAGPSTSTNTKKPRRKAKAPPPPEPGSFDDVSWMEVQDMLGAEIVQNAIASSTDHASPVKFGDIVELTVEELSSTGDGLARLPAPHPPWVVRVPFSLPGERVRVKIAQLHRLASSADLLEVLEANPMLRHDSRAQCKYFGSCGGCQYQMLSYDTQLQLKANVVNKAYGHYSNLRQSDIPTIQPTMPSPLQYGYRTKITPHFDAPPGNRQTKRGKPVKAQPWHEGWELKIGFHAKGMKKTLDIEECPIATDKINETLTVRRKDVQETISAYKNGATLLLRHSLETFSDDPVAQPEREICVTDHKVLINERVGTHKFQYPAGSFFQNNNSILPALTSYVRDAIFVDGAERPTHLVDTYCGAGLFSIVLSDAFQHTVGIEISEDSIKAAKRNAALNGIPDDRCTFRAGSAETIFETVGDFPPDKTAVVIDPPRKGCNDDFLRQLIRFRPATLVYVSCNVHTQARDVGVLVNDTREEGIGRRYRMETLRGFDLFPQTAHVESVAVLRLW